MDKKNTTIGVLLLAAALALMFTSPRRPAPPPPTQPTPVENAGTAPVGTATQPTQVENAAAPAVVPGQPVTLPAAAPAPINSMFAPIAPARADENIVTLGNEFIEVRFTNYGGAIANVALKKHQALKDSPDPLVLNAEHYAPTLALTGFPGADFGNAYTLVSQNTNQVVWRTVVAGQLEITRTYSISHDATQQDPYVVRNETTLRNLGSGALNLPARLSFNLGTAQLVHETDDAATLSVGRYDGDKMHLTARPALEASSGFLGLFGQHPARPYQEELGPTIWASVENQFFAAIVTPKQPAAGVVVRRVELPAHANDVALRYGLTSDLVFDAAPLAAGSANTLSFSLYTGPKEYARLVQLGQKQDQVMQWGSFIGFFSKLLLTLMTQLHQWVGNWGLAIILTTLVIRGLMWPLTLSSTRAAKRMAKIQGPLKELQLKYKDDRVKQQEATMKLFKEHKVNPLGGCLPLIVQMPIFFGLFSMLRSASELRFAEFLWARDLSAPDTVGHIPGIGIPINIFVLIMGATQFVQMRLTPTPATDNSSAKMMKFMPFFFTAICYNFSSGLAVYWTASNLFSIFQQWVTNRSKDPVETAPTHPGAADRAKPVKDAKVASVGDRKKKK